MLLLFVLLAHSFEFSLWYVNQAILLNASIQNGDINTFSAAVICNN